LDTLIQIKISYLDVNKHSNVVEHINWVLSELSVRVQKMLNHISRTCISLLLWNTSVFMHFISVVTTRFDVWFKLLNVTKTIDMFLAHRRGFTIRLKKPKPRVRDFNPQSC